MISIDATLDHNTGIDAATTKTAHDDLAQPTYDTATDLTMTHHTCNITDCLHIATLQVINCEIRIGDTHDHPTYLQGMNHADEIHTPAG